MADRSLYDTDFALWSAEQAAAIRAAASSGANLPLDWENLAEEIESLGKSLRRELASITSTVIEHLLKLECSPATDPKPGWIETVAQTRAKIDRLLEENPSLRRDLDDMISSEEARAGKVAAAALAARREPTAALHAKLAAGGHSVDQVYGDWLPDPAPTHP